MMKVPPPLPETVVTRVIRIARLDGWGVVIVAGLSTLIALVLRDFVGATVAGFVTAAGFLELRGARLLRADDSRGMKWLIASQASLLVTLLGYCFLSLRYPHGLSTLRAAIPADAKAQLEMLGWNLDDFIQLFYRLVYYSVAFATVLYQGGMILYYLRRKNQVTVTLDLVPPPPRLAPQ
jgi:hypothetical protein